MQVLCGCSSSGDATLPPRDPVNCGALHLTWVAPSQQLTVTTCDPQKWHFLPVHLTHPPGPCPPPRQGGGRQPSDLLGAALAGTALSPVLTPALRKLHGELGGGAASRAGTCRHSVRACSPPQAGTGLGIPAPGAAQPSPTQAPPTLLGAPSCRCPRLWHRAAEPPARQAITSCRSHRTVLRPTAKHHCRLASTCCVSGLGTAPHAGFLKN